MEKIKVKTNAIKTVIGITLLFTFFSNSIQGQTVSTTQKSSVSQDSIGLYDGTGSDSELICWGLEEMPEYPGGLKAMFNFIGENIKYPKQAIEDSIHGKVFINFVVEKDGQLSNIRVLRGIGGGCDKEAIRVVKLMPNWISGKQRGKSVRVSYVLPLKFEL